MRAVHPIISHYRETLGKHDMQLLGSQPYSGLFLPVPLSEFLQSSCKIMLVGQETRGWRGLLSQFIAARNNDALDAYIEAGAGSYERWRRRRPGHSKYGQMLRQTEKHLGLAPQSVHWANLVACSYKGKSPLKRPREELDRLERLSLDLLGHQVACLQPSVMLFVTGPSYDRILKEFCREHLDGHQDTIHLTPRKLWAFRSRGVLCVRTTHPRYVADAKWRVQAVELIRVHIKLAGV